MLTFIAFVLTMLGCINWLLIGMLQYDFIAGFFGFQASIFSRICYILFGIGALYLIIRMIANKGSFKIYEKRKKNKPDTTNRIAANSIPPAYANVEADKEQIPKYIYVEKPQNDAQRPDFSNLREYNQKNFEEDDAADSVNLERKRSFETKNHSDNENNLFDEHIYRS